ncbi:NADP-dependent oxidoreductase domain-containing protein [Aspergillus karnatakaensis]|uniref:aldo/keto reductase family protein n=1 Tax=Aspergillus karnatakaensis TaxID=1810916 RepID=UPI003CCD4488
MSAPSPLIFGGACWSTPSDFGGTEHQQAALTLLHASGVTTIDTAVIYGSNESILGDLNAAATHTIDTKFPGGFGSEPATKDNIVASALASLERTKAGQFDVYYIHAPDRDVSLEVQLEGVNELYQSGKIWRFGLSNFLPDEVEAVMRIVGEKGEGFVRPSVYQGNYSAVARHAEGGLFPVLRKYGITFYAYSPIAGGFLAKSVGELVAAAGGWRGEGRWDPETFLGKLYHGLYNKGSLIEALKVWEGISNDAGISRAELAYRWVVYNSGLKVEDGDRVVIGARNLEQLQETLAAVRMGPLPKEIVDRIDGIWRIVQEDAPVDNFNK